MRADLGLPPPAGSPWGSASCYASACCPIWATFRARHPRWRLYLQQASFVDLFPGLRGGEIDTRTGRVIERGPVVRSEEEHLALISTGEIVTLLPVT